MVVLYKTKPLKKRRSEKRELFIRKIRASLLFIAGFALGFLICHLIFSLSQQAEGISRGETPSLSHSFHSEAQYKDRVLYTPQGTGAPNGNKPAIQAKLYTEDS